MLTDALVNFLQPGTSLPILGVSVASNVVDLLGSGVGTAPANIIGTRTVFGEDAGIGAIRPQTEVILGPNAFVGGTSLNVQFQGAVDSGVGGGYQPGTWITLVETGLILTASLTAYQKLARFDFPPAFPEGTLPRFLRLFFVPAGTFSAGVIGSAPVTMVRDDQSNKFAAKNFALQTS